jgi:hypothetical protein
MSAKRAADEATVHLYPTNDAFIPGEPATERDVPAEEAKALLAYQPPAYTTSPPGEPAAEALPAEEPEPQE